MPTLDDIKSLVGRGVAEIERLFNWDVLVDPKALEACDVWARKTLDQMDGIDSPDEFKMAGHYAFWIRKLKPFSLYNSDDLTQLFTSLGKSETDTRAFLPMHVAPPTGLKAQFVNELISVAVAGGILEYFGHRLKVGELPTKFLHDWVVGLRYHSYSPSALSILVEGIVQTKTKA